MDNLMLKCRDCNVRTGGGSWITIELNGVRLRDIVEQCNNDELDELKALVAEEEAERS